jgi:hypothetical protein
MDGPPETEGLTPAFRLFMFELVANLMPAIWESAEAAVSAWLVRKATIYPVRTNSHNQRHDDAIEPVPASFWNTADRKAFESCQPKGCQSIDNEKIRKGKSIPIPYRCRTARHQYGRPPEERCTLNGGAVISSELHASWRWPRVSRLHAQAILEGGSLLH